MRSSSGRASRACAPRGCCRTSTTGSRCSNATNFPTVRPTASAVPQGRHVHLLMARGAQELDTHFPGLLDDMVAAGVPILENRPDCIHFGAAGHVLGTTHRLRDEFTAYVPSRPQLEWQIRRRATAIANVDVVHAGVAEPTFDADRQRVTGVRPTPVRRYRPISSSTPRAAAPGCRSGWSSGVLTALPRTASTSASATPHTSCAFRTA